MDANPRSTLSRPRKVCVVAMTVPLRAIPLIDVRNGGPPLHARQSAERARALRDACIDFFSAGGASHGAGARLAVASLTEAFALAVSCGDCANSHCARFLGRVATECLIPVGMHRAGWRRGRRAVADAHARLAVSRPWPSH